MGKVYKLAEGYTTQDLIHGSIDHLSAAKMLYKSGSPELLDSAGYLAHLSIELILKAMLLKAESEFPETHKLDGLLSRVVPNYPKVSFRKKDSVYRDILLSLDKCYELRYPKPKKPIGVSAGDWEAVKMLFDRLVEAMPIELQSQIESISTTHKFGRDIIRKK